MQCKVRCSSLAHHAAEGKHQKPGGLQHTMCNVDVNITPHGDPSDSAVPTGHCLHLLGTWAPYRFMVCCRCNFW
jgi:hypothetical protein